MNPVKFIAALAFDGLAIALIVFGVMHYNKAEVLREYTDDPYFGNMNQELLESHEWYYTLYFSFAGLAFFIAALLILSWVKDKRRAQREATSWNDLD